MHKNNSINSVKVCLTHMILICLLSMSFPGNADQHEANDFETRLDYFSRLHLGKKYLLSPLGEAKGLDKDPEFRLDAFDCTTYVETVMALALSQTQNHTARLDAMRKIRYQQASVDFQNRRHLPAFQWLPELIKQGNLKDITDTIGGKKTRWLNKKISPKIWQQRRKALLPQLKTSAISSRQIRLPYLKLTDFADKAHQVQEIAVISVVRIRPKNTPVIITHQALLIPQKAGSPRVRHARKKPGRVVEESLQRFITRLSRNRKPRVLGVNLADITQAGTDINRSLR